MLVDADTIAADARGATVADRGFKRYDRSDEWRALKGLVVTDPRALELCQTRGKYAMMSELGSAPTHQPGPFRVANYGRAMME